MKKPKICNFIIMLIVTAMLGGCGGVQNTAELTYEKTLSDTYPVESNEELTYYMFPHVFMTSHSASMNETAFAKQLILETGINVKFIHPTSTDEKESFTLLIASNDLPDIVETRWFSYYPGGVQKAIDEKVIYSLNKIIDAYSPNYKKLLESNEFIEKNIKTDNGDYSMYAFIRPDPQLCTYYGPYIRRDLFEKTGLSEPETVEDWEEMLTAFKNLGCEMPLHYRLKASDGLFGGAFGITNDFYHDDGVVKYGYYEEGFRDFLTTFARWYENGLIDNDIITRDAKKDAAIMGSGQVGASFGTCGGELGPNSRNLAQNVPGASYMPIKYPTAERGTVPKFGQKELAVVNNGCAAITTQCKNVELAARFLDYGYSEAGQLLYNFGVLGESYEMIDNYPTYTDTIMKSTELSGLSMAQEMSKYMRGNSYGPFAQRVEYMDQYYTTEDQKKTFEIWPKTDADKHILPYVSKTAEEEKRFSSIMGNVGTYIEEMKYKFIMGQEDLSQIDNYFAQLKAMGIEDAIAIQQAAYERYLKR